MTVITSDLFEDGHLRYRRFSEDEYMRMAECGILAREEHVDLVEGLIVSYAPPQGAPHAFITCDLHRVLGERLARRAVLWSQLPVIIAEGSELEPDLAILRPPSHRYRTALPRIADVLALVEVSDTSLRYDRGAKLARYAAAGVVEYWIVDVRGRRIESYRSPREREYTEFRLALPGDALSFAEFPDVAFSIDELLG